MLKKIKKAVPAFVSAVLCAAITFGTAASAQSIYDSWGECAEIANSSFDQNYIDLVIKYHSKETKNTVSFGKSRTKKFGKSLAAQVRSSKPECSLEISDKNNIILFTQKGSRIKIVECASGYDNSYSYGYALFTDGKTATAFAPETKTKAKLPADADQPYALSDLSTDEFDLSDSETGKIFKFKSGEKIYYYEEFTLTSYAQDCALGLLFDENGNILAMLGDDEVFCVSFRTTVDDSEFDMPKGYKTVGYDEFEY